MTISKAKLSNPNAICPEDILIVSRKLALRIEEKYLNMLWYASELQHNVESIEGYRNKLDVLKLHPTLISSPEVMTVLKLICNNILICHKMSRFSDIYSYTINST